MMKVEVVVMIKMLMMTMTLKKKMAMSKIKKEEYDSSLHYTCSQKDVVKKLKNERRKI